MKNQPKSEAKERIEKEATNHGLRVMEYTKDFHDGINTKDAYIAGATAEHNLAQEEITRLKAELEKEKELRSELWAAMANARYLLSHTSTDDLSWIDNLLKKSLIEKAKDL